MTKTLQDKIDAMRIYDSEECSQDLIILNDVNKAIQELREEIEQLKYPRGYGGFDAYSVKYNDALRDILALIGEKE